MFTIWKSRPLAPAVALLAVLALTPLTSAAQSVVLRTPNLSNGWAAIPGVVQFNLTHRLDVSEAPLRKLTNTPTFQVATAIAGPLGVGFTYGSNSDLVPAYPNEWEWFARLSPLSQDAGSPLDASLQAAWNVASESFDAELSAARQWGPVRVLAAGRAFHHAFYQAGDRYALAAGATLRLTPVLTVAGDYAALLDRADSERAVWGAGVQLTIPSTPHSLSIHATNVGTGTLEGASRGSRTRWGFEYTVPITLRRYAPSRAGRNSTTEASLSTAQAAAAPARRGDTVVITIQNFRFSREKITIDAGDVIVWRNADPVEHVIRDDRMKFESPVIPATREWAHEFTTPGTYTYHCKPHPFMKAEIHVREMKR